MPPKRKSLPVEADEKSRKSKVVKKVEQKTRKDVEYSTKLESEYKEPIKYDEYMEGGIPSSLLEGLGFTETEAPQELNTVDDDENLAEEDSGVISESMQSLNPSVAGAHSLSEAISSYVVDQISAMAKSGMISGLLPQQIVDLAMASSSKGAGFLSTQAATVQSKKSASPPVSAIRTSRRLSSRNSTPTTTITIDSSRTGGAKVYAPAPVVRPAQIRAMATYPTASGIRQIVASTPNQMPQKLMPRNARVYNSSPRTVTKGNIVYERMPTGEVIASLIKKPSSEGSSGRSNQGNGDSMMRGSQSSYRPAQTNTLAPVSIDDCPINEYNVGEVLEKSIKATQSMKMLLTSLRDDLRRIGAGTAMVTEEQVRKRQEVADKLTKAYATYKRSIEDIEIPQVPENTRVIAASAASAGSMSHRVIEKPPESIRPVMLVKHGIAIGPGTSMSNEQGTMWRSSTANRQKINQDQGEVIELLESDEEDVPKKSPQKESNTGKGNNIRKGQSARSDDRSRREAEKSNPEQLGQKKKEQNSRRRTVKEDNAEDGETKLEQTRNDANSDSLNKDCNGSKIAEDEM